MFREPKSEQGYLKALMFGPAGSGKTFTSLLLAEGLVRGTGKEVAFVDTEGGADWYFKDVKERAFHPEAFKAKVMQTRQLAAVIKAVKGFDTSQFGVIIIDSFTHLWEAAQQAWDERNGNPKHRPMYAWGNIKRPYKKLISDLLNLPVHVILLARQGNVFETDENSKEIRQVGVKAKTEGETPYEPSFLFRMESVRQGESAVPTLFIEKDRSGVLQGKEIPYPDYDKVAKPIVRYLDPSHASLQDSEDAARLDSVEFEDEEREFAERSETHHRHFIGRISLAVSDGELELIGKEITPAIKKELTSAHHKEIRDKFLERRKELKK